jgi:hypothetical protein
MFDHCPEICRKFVVGMTLRGSSHIYFGWQTEVAEPNADEVKCLPANFSKGDCFIPNEENTRQVNQANDNSNDSSDETVLAAIQALDSRVTNLEEIILARLNDTRPFEHKIMARLDDLISSQVAMQKQIDALQEGQVAMREDLNQFRQETNQNFRLINQSWGT